MLVRMMAEEKGSICTIILSLHVSIPGYSEIGEDMIKVLMVQGKC
jgi:hypothetical protein